MRILPALVLVLAAVPAAAQSDNVTVNGDGNGRTLVDPATGQSRYVPPLLQPWDDTVIRLRPPGHHRVRSAPPPAEVAAAPEPPRKKPVRTAVAAPPPRPVVTRPVTAKPPVTQPTSLSNLDDIDLITGGTMRQAAPPPVRTASIEKPKPAVSAGTRKDSILFGSGASDPSGEAVSSARSLATSLSASMGDTARVWLKAYAGPRNEKSSDTRRLSLKRAKVVRQILIDGGVPADRIDVFALGGSDDDGPLDRVDVFLKR